MKQLSFFLLLLPVFSGLFAQRTIRCVVFNHSYDPPRPEKFAKITPLSGGNTVELGTDAGIFELRITGVKPGDRLELIVSKDGHQILGPNPTIFTYAVPADEGEPIKIAIIKNSDFDSRKADYEKAIEKRISQANKALLDSIARLQTQKLTEDERAGLTKFIGQQNGEIEELRKNKDELAAKLAQVDLDQASEFAQLALKKFRDEGDVKAALALMPDEKLEEFWENMLTQEEKVKRARQQGVENYMIRARLLVADFQFPLAYKNYLEAIDKDSTNLDNLWEVAYFLDAQNQHQRAILLYEKCLTLAKSGAQRAAFLNSLGILYKNNNRMKEAENAFSEALSGYRILSDKNSDAFLPDVASILNNLGNFYRDNQKMPEAEKAYNEALDIRRQLAAKNPDASLPNVATTLNNLGEYYRDNNKMPEAEKAYNEALSIQRQLATKKPDAFLPDMAGTLNNVGNFYSANQKMLEAEKAYNEALSIYRQLAVKNPDAFLPYVATTLNNLGVFYLDNQKMPEAEKAYNEALSIYRELAAKNPDAFLPYVATTLNNLGVFYLDNQKMPEAEKAYNEALSIRRQLAAKNPDVFLPYVATILNNLGAFYLDNQKMPEAEKAFNEALSIRRQLAARNPDAFLPEVASTCGNLAILYRSLNQMDKAEGFWNETIKIHRNLSNTTPDAFLPLLAQTLNNLGNFYSANQKMPEAEKAYNEALDIRRQLAAKNPDAFLPNVAMTLSNLGVFYETLKKYPQALKHYEEALLIRQADLMAGKTYFFKDWIQVFGNISRVKDSTESKKLYPLTVRARYLLAVSCDSLKEIDERIFNQSVSEYGSLSWWALFALDYPLAERAALRCLALAPEQIYVYTNLGHAHLLRGDLQKAKAAYLLLKGKKDGGGKDYKIVLEEDFQALEAEGITHKGMAEIRKWLAEGW